MNGLHPIKMPSAKEKVAAELRKAIAGRGGCHVRECGESAGGVGHAGA